MTDESTPHRCSWPIWFWQAPRYASQGFTIQWRRPGIPGKLSERVRRHGLWRALSYSLQVMCLDHNPEEIWNRLEKSGRR